MKPIFEGWAPVMSWAEYNDGVWSNPKAVSQGQIAIHPGAMALQFGSSLFEGGKAIRVSDRVAHGFRPDENYQRITRSCARLCMPAPSESLFMRSIEIAMSQASSWSSPIESEWLYIRPVIIGLDDHIMPIRASRYAFYVLVAPIRAFSPPSFNLWVEHRYSRAASGGLGYAKTAANYAHQLLSTVEAKRAECDAVVWLDANLHEFIEEASTMNLFFRVADQVITPVLTDTILPGITRQSVLALMQDSGQPVIERAISITELMQWIEAGQLKEIFATSTALGVRHIDTINIGGIRYECASDITLSSSLAEKLKQIYLKKSFKHAEWITTFKINERVVNGLPA
jgi:branched-chain amino acid aminotransferase